MHGMKGPTFIQLWRPKARFPEAGPGAGTKREENSVQADKPHNKPLWCPQENQISQGPPWGLRPISYALLSEALVGPLKVRGHPVVQGAVFHTHHHGHGYHPVWLLTSSHRNLSTFILNNASGNTNDGYHHAFRAFHGDEYQTRGHHT